MQGSKHLPDDFTERLVYPKRQDSPEGRKDRHRFDFSSWRSCTSNFAFEHLLAEMTSHRFPFLRRAKSESEHKINA
jgi:hypothetical protein